MKNRQRRSSREPNHYFTQVHEDAIIGYVNSDDLKEKTYLYENFIQPAFSEMVDKIVFTYKFTTLPNCDDLREECKIWLVTVLDKYSPEKAKAFSYFSVVSKNWFIHKVKQQKKKNTREIDLDNISKKYEEQYLSTQNAYEVNRLQKEFWQSFYEEIKDWNTESMKENDLKVYKAILILFESKEDIEIFNKKAIYLYLREITDLNTKQIVNSLKKFRKQYSSFKEDWENGLI